MFVVPHAARMAGWLNAWLADRESTDAVISGMIGADTEHEFAIEPGTRLTPALLLGELRRMRVHRVTVALPVPGDPIGLGGPATFNADALEAGQAVLLHGPGKGLVPHQTSHHAVWSLAEAFAPTYLPDVATADRELRSALTRAANDLAELDVASWNPDVADALMNLRATTRLDAPMSFPTPQATRLALSGLRAAEICRLAGKDDGGAVTASEMGERNAALTPLRAASHTAVVAACSSVDGQ